MATKLPTEDHDLLIRLDTKMDALGDDMKAQNAIFLKELTNHEHRITDIEKVHDKIQPEIVAKDVSELKGWKAKLEARWKLVVGVSAALGTASGTALGILLIKIFSKGT